MSVIHIQNVAKKYGRVVALDGVSVEVPAGSVVGLVGPNGCGKSTLIKSILGLVIPNSGTIHVKGIDVRSGPGYRAQIGYMPQNPEFPGGLTVADVFEMLEDIRQAPATLKAELVEELGLAGALQRPIGVLSGGTRQRVAAVASMMFGSPVLVLDEPTVGLDPVSAAAFKARVRAHAGRGGSVLLVSHIMSEMESLADQVVFMLDGKVRFQGPLTSLGGRFESAVVDLMKGGHL